ncbi:hypothetical protein [Flavilitoribacter nigricans]|uniref:Lipoprotein n=1 Tax=Flavilitoribacter nigricans (strain ATCC 23147 / DSM 23189 / NBRC 102662 / NCIMB 1420 / SS-2) TaxID=1122177 RepID=A0A2D0NGE6_FLAN2|nr:hypothetical protein [Flavilitoribacter nigricans]PHN07460.1 hypothetical protein CRP01_04990 [Flavilitoribacter nigricans DSM 23189 = NBRC 102662]
MKTSFFKSAVFAVLSLVILSACSDKDEYVGPTETNDSVITIPFFVRNDANEMPSSATDLIYESRLKNPVNAPDGHQLTWGEFSTVSGVAEAICRENGIEVQLSLSGLIPNGVYTIWNVLFEAPGMDPTDPILGLDALGAAGKGDGSDSKFVASATGEAQITIHSPGGDLSMVSNITIGNCPLTDNFEWHVVGAYHIDGQTYGPDLGPIGTGVEQFGFIFKNQN